MYLIWNLIIKNINCYWNFTFCDSGYPITLVSRKRVIYFNSLSERKILFNSFTLSFCFVRCVHFVAFVVFILFVSLISFPAFLSAYLPNILTIFRHSASCEQKEKNKRLRPSRTKAVDSEADSFFDICRQSSVTSLENCKQTCLDR